VPLPEPASAGSGAGAERGAAARVWIAIVVAVLAIVVFGILRPRRAGEGANRAVGDRPQGELKSGR
jgi:hypothetical protein